MREYLYPNKEIWIGKIERLILVVAVPILIVFLYIYNFIRNGIAYTINQNILFDFLYQQGNSFSYLAQGFDVLHILPMNEFPGYMLGPSYDNVVYGSIIGRMIFGTSAIVGQSMDAVTRGHNMASHLSYILLGKEYLSGYGTGTVFILEIVHDVGWGGLVLYAIVFGWLCVKIMNSFASAKIVTNVIFLYSLLEIYFVPRSSALYFLMRSFITPYFWITLLFVIAVSKLYFHFKIKVMPIKIKLVG